MDLAMEDSRGVAAAAASSVPRTAQAPQSFATKLPGQGVRRSLEGVRSRTDERTDGLVLEGLSLPVKFQISTR
jgi:hypothetical protein